MKRREQRYCPKCLYIGDQRNCSCVWTLQRVAEGKGSEPDVVKNAQTILKNVMAER